MTDRKPLVLGSDGKIQQIQSGDSLVDGSGGSIGGATATGTGFLHFTAGAADAAAKLVATTDFAANVVDTDGTLAANSDTRLATQKATKTYVDAEATARASADTTLQTNITAEAAARAAADAALQPLDADLTAIAGLSPANDDVIQRKAGAWANRTIAQLLTDLAAAGTTFQPKDTTLDTYAEIDPSANVQSILSAADYAAIRTLLGLVIGTNVQAYDADLDSWSGKTAPSGTVVGTSDTQTLTNKRFTKRVVTLTDAATVTPDCDTTDVGILTSLSQTTTFANPTGTPTDEQTLVIRVKSTSTQTVSFGANFRASANVSLPTATTGSSKTDRWMFCWNNADSKWDIMAADNWT